MCAKVVGPLMSLGASGTVGQTLTFGKWRGVQWVREWFKPANPQSTTQTNVRTAFQLAIAYFQDTLSAAQKTAYDTGAEGEEYSGYNLYMKRVMNEYITDLGSSTTPVSVTVTGDYPSETITWSDT